jgi:predicted nucleic acid-binding protein
MICVDSSVAVKWLVREQHSQKARALLRVHLDRQEAIVAPPLLPIEIANILRQHVRAGKLAPAHARERLTRFLALPISYVTSLDLYTRALLIAVDHNLPAVYDPSYVGLAESMECPFWTADQRLIRAIGATFPFLHWIGEYEGGQSQSRR